MPGNSSVQFLNALAVDDGLIKRLASLPFSATGTRRICLHESEASPLHAMLVESVAESEFPGHAHSDSDEVTLAVKGRLDIRIWDKGVTVAPSRMVLGTGENETRMVFVPKDVPHITKALGGNCVYLEVKLGPFKKDALVLIERALLAE